MISHMTVIDVTGFGHICHCHYYTVIWLEKVVKGSRTNNMM